MRMVEIALNPLLRHLGEAIQMTDEKIETLKNTESVESLKEVHRFLGFANFYRRFIKDHSKICFPLTRLNPGDWKPILETRIAQLVDFLTSPPKHFGPSRQTIVETRMDTGAGDYISISILDSQFSIPDFGYGENIRQLEFSPEEGSRAATGFGPEGGFPSTAKLS